MGCHACLTGGSSSPAVEREIEMLNDKTKYIKHSISEELWRQARARAIMEGKPVGQWLNELIEWALRMEWKCTKTDSKN